MLDAKINILAIATTEPTVPDPTPPSSEPTPQTPSTPPAPPTMTESPPDRFIRKSDDPKPDPDEIIRNIIKKVH